MTTSTHIALNIRGHRVVDPTRTNEYDREMRRKPAAPLYVGAAAFTLSLALGAVLASPAVIVAGIVAVLAGSAVAGYGLHRRARVVSELTRDLDLLRYYIVFDAHHTESCALWVAAGIAEQIAAIDEEAWPLEEALARTTDQESQLHDASVQRSDLAERALALVTA